MNFGGVVRAIIIFVIVNLYFLALVLAIGGADAVFGCNCCCVFFV